MERHEVHYILSTHWDREWYQNFQDFRYRFVQLLDQVLDGFNHQTLNGPFQTDGQAILLEDYLEVRPERKNEIEKRVKEGLLVVGPWYVQPDEFLVSGESLIRNLRMGRQLVRSFGGEPSNAGFMCDMFGHNSQMPQLLAGFGIKGTFIWRGVNLPDKRLVMWQGSDGTKLPTYLFGKNGYVDFSAKVRRCCERNQPFDPAQCSLDFDQYVCDEISDTPVDVILAFDGADHQAWDQKAYAHLFNRDLGAGKDFDFVHSSLDRYLEKLILQLDRIDSVIEGEQREPGKFNLDRCSQWVIPGVLSSRVWIKQENAECQTLLCQWAEPFSLMASAVTGMDYPCGFLDVAWKWLIQNHPHDSICGCSIDQVHEDMKYRFSQSRGLAHRLTKEAISSIGISVEGDIQDDQLRVVVFNPLARPINEPVEVVLEIPSEWACFNEFFGFEKKPAFQIFDDQGNEIPYQRLAQNDNRTKFRIRGTKFPEDYTTNDVKVSLHLDLPALGYTTLRVQAAKAAADADGNMIAGEVTRYCEVPGLAINERAMENEFLAVTIESNGTLSVKDKQSGQEYHRVLTFEDTADIGDGWYHGQAVNDQTYVSTGSYSEIALVHNGPNLCTFRCRTTFVVPEEFDFSTMSRSERRTDLVIDNLISLRAGCARIEVSTTVLNTAKDHRLRVLLPSGARAETYWADSPFDVLERPIALRKDNHLCRELEVETKPQKSWTAVGDGDRGLAVISSGLIESAVRDLPERPIALTLLRATRKTVFTNTEPKGQLLQPLSFNYWIVPFNNGSDAAELCNLGLQLAAGIRTAQLRAIDMSLYPKQKTLPAKRSFLQIEGQAVLSSLQQIDGGLEMRVFNPEQSCISCCVQLDKSLAITHAVEVDFEGNPKGAKLPVSDGALTISLRSKQILTLQFKS